MKWLLPLLLAACKNPDDSGETDPPIETDETDLAPDTDRPPDTDETDLPPETDLEETDLPPDTGDTDETDPRWRPRDDITIDWDPVDSGGRVTIDLVHSGASGFYLCLAETSNGGAGWYGEDCATFGGCHYWSSVHGRLDYVDTLSAVVMSRTTVFDGGSDGAGDAFTGAGADRLTYLLQLDGGPFDTYCYVWGDDPSYYATEGCKVL